MSRKAKGSPIHFQAGGKKPASGSKSTEISHHEIENGHKVTLATSQRHALPRNRKSNLFSIVTTGLHRKRSPLHMKNWIACLLTLDGRDKFTKVLQYGSRFLSWYFAGLASRSLPTGILGEGAVDSLQYKFYCQEIAVRFHSLYKSLVESRKAFRIGRSFIEFDKLKEMGWGQYLREFLLLHPLESGVAAAAYSKNTGHDTSTRDNNGQSALEEYGATHSIPEHHDEDQDNDSKNESNNNDDNARSGEKHERSESWEVEGETDSETEDRDGVAGTPSTNLGQKNMNKHIGHKQPPKVIISKPGRPHLPSRISSNIGWGPMTTTTTIAAPSDTANSVPQCQHFPVRTVSDMGRQMYKPFPSRSSSMRSYKQIKEENMTVQTITTSASATPAWKLVGGTLKLLGLMGFWAFDNLAFFTGTGCLDPILIPSLSASSNSDSDNSLKHSKVSVDVKDSRIKRQKRAAEWAARFYFMGSAAGLFVNARAIWQHRTKKLREAREQLHKAALSSDGKGLTVNHEHRDDTIHKKLNNIEKISTTSLSIAKQSLHQAESEHFELYVALLKSICDFLVFSNNPGVDLHLKLRGKKNHEGLHCCFGLISAGTVLYNNFPNAK